MGRVTHFLCGKCGKCGKCYSRHFAKCLPCLSMPRLPPNTASPKTELGKSYAHRNFWAYLPNKRQKYVVPLQRNFKTTAPARVRPDPSGLRDAWGTAQHTHPYRHESPNIAVKGATQQKEIPPLTTNH